MIILFLFTHLLVVSFNFLQDEGPFPAFSYSEGPWN